MELHGALSSCPLANVEAQVNALQKISTSKALLGIVPIQFPLCVGFQRGFKTKIQLLWTCPLKITFIHQLKGNLQLRFPNMLVSFRIITKIMTYFSMRSNSRYFVNCVLQSSILFETTFLWLSPLRIDPIANTFQLYFECFWVLAFSINFVVGFFLALRFPQVIYAHFRKQRTKLLWFVLWECPKNKLWILLSWMDCNCTLQVVWITRFRRTWVLKCSAKLRRHKVWRAKGMGTRPWRWRYIEGDIIQTNILKGGFWNRPKTARGIKVKAYTISYDNIIDQREIMRCKIRVSRWRRWMFPCISGKYNRMLNVR